MRVLSSPLVPFRCSPSFSPILSPSSSPPPPPRPSSLLLSPLPSSTGPRLRSITTTTTSTKKTNITTLPDAQSCCCYCYCYHGCGISASSSPPPPPPPPHHHHQRHHDGSQSPSSVAPRIFIKGLSCSTCAGFVAKTFSHFGEVCRVKIITSRNTKQSLGLAYVWFTCEQNAKSAVKEMDGKFFDGRFVSVTMARPESLTRQSMANCPFKPPVPPAIPL